MALLSRRQRGTLLMLPSCSNVEVAVQMCQWSRRGSRGGSRGSSGSALCHRGHSLSHLFVWIHRRLVLKGDKNRKVLNGVMERLMCVGWRGDGRGEGGGEGAISWAPNEGNPNQKG